jgi:hypothetical protein
MSDDNVLKELKEKIERLKKEKALKEGERNAIFAQIQKEFGVKTIDEAYEKLQELSEGIEVKKERREELLKTAQERLAEYR